MTVAGIVLSQPLMQTMPSKRWPRATSSIESAMTSRLTRLVFMPARPHRHAVGDRDRVELHRRAAGLADALLDLRGERAVGEVARHRLDPAVGDADDRLGERLGVEADAVQVGARGGAGGALGEGAGAVLEIELGHGARRLPRALCAPGMRSASAPIGSSASPRPLSSLQLGELVERRLERARGCRPRPAMLRRGARRQLGRSCSSALDGSTPASRRLERARPGVGDASRQAERRADRRRAPSRLSTDPAGDARRARSSRLGEAVERALGRRRTSRLERGRPPVLESAATLARRPRACCG